MHLYDYSDPNFLQEAIDLDVKAQMLARELNPPNIDLESQARQNLVLLLTYSPRQEQAIVEAKNLAQWSELNYGEEHMNTINAYSLLINAYFTSGNANEALTILDKIEPIINGSDDLSQLFSSEVYTNKATAYLMLGKYKEGLAISEKGLIETELEDFNIWSTSILDMISEHAYYLGYLEKSEASIKKSIESDPNDLDFNKSFRYSKLAEIQLSKNNLEKASDYANRALEFSNQNSSAHSILAHVAWQNNNPKQAIEQFKIAEKVFKENYGMMGEDYLLCLADLTLIYSLTGQPDKALKYANQIKIGNSTTVYAAVMQLSIMAANIASGQKIDSTIAREYYNIVKTHWSKNIYQYKFAEKAAHIIGIIE